MKKASTNYLSINKKIMENNIENNIEDIVDNAKEIEDVKDRINKTINESNLIKILEDDELVVIDTTCQIKELKQDVWKLIRELCKMSDI